MTFYPGDLIVFDENRLVLVHEHLVSAMTFDKDNISCWYIRNKGVYFVISNIRNYLYIIDEYKKAGWIDASVIRHSKRIEYL